MQYTETAARGRGVRICSGGNASAPQLSPPAHGTRPAPPEKICSAWYITPVVISCAARGCTVSIHERICRFEINDVAVGVCIVEIVIQPRLNDLSACKLMEEQLFRTHRQIIADIFSIFHWGARRGGAAPDRFESATATLNPGACSPLRSITTSSAVGKRSATSSTCVRYIWSFTAKPTHWFSG